MERPKRKKEDDEKQRLTAVFEQFRDEFENSKVMHINQSFVKSEVVNANKSGESFQPVIKKPVSIEEAKRLASEVGRKILLEAQQKKVAAAIQTGSHPLAAVSTDILPKDTASTSTTARPPKPGSNKNSQKSRMTSLESFKQELKQIQEMRENRRDLREQLKQKYGDDIETIDRIAPSLDNPYLQGEFSDDPTTTNLYLANLPPDVELNDLYETFGSFGPLASAKILYPRGENEHRIGSALSGFTAFMSRTDAERAISVMRGAKISNYDIRVNWAKPVNLPAVPFYIPDSLKQFAMPDHPSGLPFNAKPQPSELRKFLNKYEDLPRLGVPLPNDDLEMVEDYKKMIKDSIIRVVTPTDKPLLVLIHRVIEFLIREGAIFEACLMEREKANPLYRFMFDNNHPTHVYYRWKLYSLMNGESPTEWRTERFRMFKDGSWWEPPPLTLNSGMPPQLYSKAYKPEKSSRVQMHHRSRSNSPEKKRSRLSSKNEEESYQLRGVLSKLDREYLDNLLEKLTPEKISIGDAMVWCLDHADRAKEITQCLVNSLAFSNSPLHKKIASFYLISDILGNCGNVRVKDVFFYRQHFQEHLEQIFVLLNSTLESVESRIKAEQFRQRIMMSFRMWEDNNIFTRDILIKSQNIFLGLIKPTTSADNESEDDDLDGVPLNKAVDEDDDEDLDGVPINLSGSKLRSSSPKESRNSTYNQPNTTNNKWNQDTLDNFTSKWDDPVTSEPIAIKEDRSEKNGNSESFKLISNDSCNEERRRLLREIELKIVEYQDELEMDGVANIDKKLNDYRQKLMETMEKDLEEFDEGQVQSSSKKKSLRDDRKESKSSKKHHSNRDRRSRSRSRERHSTRSRHKSRSPKGHRNRSHRSRS